MSTYFLASLEANFGVNIHPEDHPFPLPISNTSESKFAVRPRKIFGIHAIAS